MTDVLMPFALRLVDQRMVGVADVPGGLECGCICPGCKAAVIAVHGAVYRHHFRHTTELGACEGARETALHRFAKQIIHQHMEVRYPGLPGMGDPISAELEPWLDNFRPDVLIQYAEEPIAVEIHVAHQVPIEKVERIIERQLACIEIDLRDYRHVELDEANLKQAVLVQAPRRWIYEPAVLRKARDLKIAALAERARRAEEAVYQREMEYKVALALEQEQWEAGQALWRAEQAEAQARRAVVEAEMAERDRQRQIELHREAERERARQEARDAQRRPPNLQALVEAHGTYSQITEAAWKQYWSDLARWKDRVQTGYFYENVAATFSATVITPKRP
jgi:competence CoiA-like predicted nuclease